LHALNRARALCSGFEPQKMVTTIARIATTASNSTRENPAPMVGRAAREPSPPRQSSLRAGENAGAPKSRRIRCVGATGTAAEHATWLERFTGSLYSTGRSQRKQNGNGSAKALTGRVVPAAPLDHGPVGNQHVFGNNNHSVAYVTVGMVEVLRLTRG